MLPSHGGAVVGIAPLTAVGDGELLISGAHDGTLRVWDLRHEGEEQDDGFGDDFGEVSITENKIKCLYGLGGYKVWLGSVCTDGERIVSDGRDNAVVVHDFSTEEQWTKGDVP